MNTVSRKGAIAWLAVICMFVTACEKSGRNASVGDGDANAAQAARPADGGGAQDAVGQVAALDDDAKAAAAQNATAASAAAVAAPAAPGKPGKEAAKVAGWLHWRGPTQNGVSEETRLPATLSLDAPADGGNLLWTHDVSGRGTPVIAGDRVYSWGYTGDGADLREVLACLNAETGEVIWEHRFSDFLSDVIYDRYSIGAPTVDPRTGNVFLMTSPGLLMSFTPDGKLLWRISLGEEFGRLTFPNGRTGAPVIDGDLVIVNTISTNWGAQGPPRNRFYAFEKSTGLSVWASTPGVGPPFLKDSSFSTPVLAWDHQGRRVFYAGIGSGALVCINALTGQPIWRFQAAVGGLNSTPVLYDAPDGKRYVIEIHGVQNTDSSKIGRMFAVRADAEPGPPDATAGGAPVLGKDAEVWRNDLDMFTSSPILVGDRVYQVTTTGELWSVDANTGKKLWSMKLGSDQIHASPTYADGKLYVPMNNGSFWIIKPGETEGEELARIQLAGNCLGAPAVWNGKVYVHTTRRLYCFGTKGDNAGRPGPQQLDVLPKAGPAVALRAIPDEVILAPGSKQKVDVYAIDKLGVPAGTVTNINWARFIPPTAKVRAEMDADFDKNGEIVAAADAQQSAGAFKATAQNVAGASGAISGVIRGRVLPKLPYAEDFESFDLDEVHPTEMEKFSYPPLPWIGARFKWDIREQDGSKTIAKTLDNLILQRAITFFGPSTAKNYTLQADMMTDGNRRLRSEVGLVNQRYIIVLKGNHRQIEVNSNQERIKAAVPFPVEPKVWYTLKTRVDVNPDGSGTVRAKVWERGKPEPAEWTIEVPHGNVHEQGAPGFFGFAPQNKFRVYIDNIKVTPNENLAAE